MNHYLLTIRNTVYSLFAFALITSCNPAGPDEPIGPESLGHDHPNGFITKSSLNDFGLLKEFLSGNSPDKGLYNKGGFGLGYNFELITNDITGN